jgi:hypothetical protein
MFIEIEKHICDVPLYKLHALQQIRGGDRRCAREIYNRRLFNEITLSHNSMTKTRNTAKLDNDRNDAPNE